MRRIAAEEAAEEARGEVNMVAPPRATADTNQDRNHEHPEPTLGEPKLTAPAPGSATTPESATGSARSAGLQVDAGIVAHSPDSTIESRKQSAYIFQALVTPIPSLPLQQHERGVPIIPKGRLATTIDTSLRGFTDVATSRVEPSEPGGKKDDQGSS